MVNPSEHYDALVVGAGQGGGPLSTALARAGLRTALIEREHVGGTCINRGCTPTKTMAASARIAYLAKRAGIYGVKAEGVRVEMEDVRARKREMVESFRAGSQKRLTDTEGLDLIFASAAFSGQKTIRLQLNTGGTRQLDADRVFINTGSRPLIPHIDGLGAVPYLDSTSIMELGTIPEHLLVLGGGYVGVEFAQMFRRFGSRVTIIQRGAQLLPREDADIAEAVATILQDDGITVILDGETTAVRGSGSGVIEARVRTGTSETTLTGSHILLAAGRSPNTDGLNLAATGLHVDERGYLRVNAKLETPVPGIYALGDVKGGPAFTHVSYDDYRILRSNLLEGGARTTTERLVPYTVFMDPQLGRIGMTEREAKGSGHRVKVATMPMASIARAVEIGETRGMMKAVVEESNGQILGCAVLGIEGGELAAMLQLAIMGGIPYTRLRDAVFAHPTLAESLNTLFASL